MRASHLTIVHYPPARHWRCVEVWRPNWETISAAIRQMDDNEYPIVQLSWKDVDTCFDDEESFNVIGGAASGFALFECVQGWAFEDPDGGDEDVWLWQSDPYVCKRKNIITDIDVVLKLSRIYFESGSYEEVQRACSTRSPD